MPTRFAWVVQHEGEGRAGLIGAALRDAGIEPRVLRADLGDPIPRDAEGASAVVVLGGPMGVYDRNRHAHLEDELALLDSALRTRTATLGICLGDQLLATAAGATVAAAPKKEIGWFRVRLAPGAMHDPILGGLPEDFVAFHWHGDAHALPPKATLLASSTLTPCQGFRIADHAWGLQFHPEVDDEQLHELVKSGERDLEGDGVEADAILKGARRYLPEQMKLFRGVFARFAQIAAVRPPSRGSATPEDR